MLLHCILVGSHSLDFQENLPLVLPCSVLLSSNTPSGNQGVLSRARLEPDMSEEPRDAMVSRARLEPDLSEELEDAMVF